MRFYKHEASSTMFVQEDGKVYPFFLQGFETTFDVIKARGLGAYSGNPVHEIEMFTGPLSEMEEVTQEYTQQHTEETKNAG